MIRIKIYFGKYNDLALLNRGGLVLVSMNGNIWYTTSAALLTVLQEKHDEFGAAKTAAETGGKAERIALTAARKEYVIALRAVGAYCNFTTPGNAVALSTTGFEMASTSRTTVIMQAIKSISLANGMDRGTMLVKVVAGAGTKQVRIEYAITTLDGQPAANDWKPCNETKRSCMISGLQSGQKIWVRATAVGSNRQKMTCEPVNMLVL